MCRCLCLFRSSWVYWFTQRALIETHPNTLSFFFIITFYFPAHNSYIEGFTLSEFLDKPWSQVSPILPPGMCLCIFFAAHSINGVQHSHCSSIFIEYS